jgi:O-antigen ligase
MTESANSNPPKSEKASGNATTNFKLSSRVSPSVSFEKNLFGSAKPPEDLLFGRLSQPESYQHESKAKPVDAEKADHRHQFQASPLQFSEPPTPDAVPTLQVGTVGNLIVYILAAMLFLASAIGSPNVDPLPDTLKSATISILTLSALLIYFWSQRGRAFILEIPTVLAWSAVLCLYALGSMFWSHTYLGAVEAVRWFIWSALIFLSFQVVRHRRERLWMLLWAVHLAAVAASLIGAMQFWKDVQWFAQGPNPASTFVNRNFAAEYVVMTLPISAYLIWRENKLWRLAALALGSALCVVFLMQTGTRSALLALSLLTVILGVSAILLQPREAACIGRMKGFSLFAALFCALFIGLGSIPTGNTSLQKEFASSQHTPTAFARAFYRYASIKADDGSLGIRQRMWSQTYKMFDEKPIFGVGAGAWEVMVPKYQPQNELVELDFYAHNEYLQLIAEYGLLGLLCLIALAVFLILSAWTAIRGISLRQRFKVDQAGQESWKNSDQADDIHLLACLLASISALAVVSLAGFPWRLAATGSLFAVLLGCIAALSPLKFKAFTLTRSMRMPAQLGMLCAGLALIGLVLAIHISNEARLAEKHIVRATSLSMGINYQAPPEMQALMRATHLEAVSQIKLGIAKNPHYRKITSQVADRLAAIGDFSNASFVYDSLIESRPYIPLLLNNAAITHEGLRNHTKQLEYAERALKLRPTYVTARSLELHALLGLGRPLEALGRGRSYMADGWLDDVGTVAVFKAAFASQDFNYALQVLRIRMERFPNTKVDSLLSTGKIQFSHLNQPEEALKTFKEAWGLSDKGSAVIAAIPPQLISQIR